MRSSSGRTRLMSALSPPAMKTKSAASAPQAAPDTGASTMATPWAASFSAVCLVSHGSDDEVSSNRLPGFMPAARPSLAKTTCCTTEPLGNMVMTTSLCSASCRSDLTARAGPPSLLASCLEFAATRSYKARVWPALCKCEAMGAPITPRPTNPMRNGCTVRVVLLMNRP